MKREKVMKTVKDLYLTNSCEPLHSFLQAMCLFTGPLDSKMPWDRYSPLTKKKKKIEQTTTQKALRQYQTKPPPNKRGK